MSFIGSSERWGEQSFARICETVLLFNDGIGQQVMENRTDLLDLMTVDELRAGDDLGLSVAFLAIYYDQPDIVDYLHKRGVDLNQPCDPMGFGTPMFYAVSLSKKRLVSQLHQLGYRVQNPCESSFHQTPLHYAVRKGDHDVTTLVDSIVHREDHAKDLLRKNMLRNRERRNYIRTLHRAIFMQKLIRGYLARRLVKMIRTGEIVLESEHSSTASLAHVEEASNEEEDGDEEEDDA